MPTVIADMTMSLDSEVSEGLWVTHLTYRVHRAEAAA